MPFSIILKGGAGVGGKGLMYLTSKGELVEICADEQLTRARVIDINKKLVEKYMEDLADKLKNKKINEDLTNSVLNELDTVTGKEKDVPIDEDTIDIVGERLKEKEVFKGEEINKVLGLMKQVQFPITPLPTDMLKQFMIRMDLIKNKEMDPLDFANQVGLEKLHYDIFEEGRWRKTPFEKFSTDVINAVKKRLGPEQGQGRVEDYHPYL
jgi:hypothetical protein